MNRFLFVIVIVFVWKKNGNQCFKILAPEKHINQKGKLRYCKKCIFFHCRRASGLTEGSIPNISRVIAMNKTPCSVFDRNEHIDK